MEKKTKERLEKLAATPAKDYTPADREFIRDLSSEMGVDFTPRQRCADCYADQALVLWKIIRDSAKDSQRRYELREGVDVIFKGQRINRETLTDELAESLIADGFALYFFARTA